jgi:hypothetical protein
MRLVSTKLNVQWAPAAVPQVMQTTRACFHSQHLTSNLRVSGTVPRLDFTAGIGKTLSCRRHLILFELKISWYRLQIIDPVTESEINVWTVEFSTILCPQRPCIFCRNQRICDKDGYTYNLHINVGFSWLICSIHISEFIELLL